MRNWVPRFIFVIVYLGWPRTTPLGSLWAEHFYKTGDARTSAISGRVLFAEI